jgi:regulator of sigma E protease
MVYGIDTFQSTAVAPEQDSVSALAGVQEGDRVLSIDGRKIDDAYQLLEILEGTAGRGAQLEIERTGQRLTVALPATAGARYGLQPLRPTTVGRVVPGMPAAEMGLREGDRILEVAGQPVHNWNAMSAEIRRHPDKTIQLVWEREGQRLETQITPSAVTEGTETFGQIGIGPQLVRHEVGLKKAVALGAQGVYRSSYLIVDFLSQLFRGDRSTEELGGPLRIAQMAGQTAEQGLNHFISFLAMLSVNLAIVNLLPVPVLDGGQLGFLTLEAVMRRPLSVRQREVFQQIGLAIMLFIMVLVTFNDLNQMVFDHIVEFFQ